MTPVSALADELRARVTAGPGRLLLGICGAPGAGKSTLAESLARKLGPDLAVVVPFDGFHVASSLIAGTPFAERRGAIDTFDLGSYRALLQRLRDRDDEEIYAPAFDRSIEDPIASAIRVPAAVPIILTEGNYLLADHPEMERVRGILDEVWFLELPEQLRLERLIARHVRFGKSPDAAAAWAHGPDHLNAVSIQATRHRADRFLVVTPDDD